MTDPQTLRQVSEQLATEAATFVQTRRAEVFGAAPVADAVQAKSTPTDPVTVVDTETERLLRDRLAELRPGEPILGEEEGGSAVAEPGVPVWVIDPIDGTVNFVYGIEAYAVSVGVQIDGVSVAGAVAHVSTGEIYSAAVGHGATVTGAGVRTELRCNTIDDLSMALVGTGFSYDSANRARQAEVLAALAELPPEQREAFLLQAEAEMSVSDIAVATGVGFETAKSRLRYARAALRRALENL